ncbi:MAG: deoxyribose-phosphate aldolase [Phycisphaeraceae bacterium]|nr:deoxyribose-phosphate aldolase [Phycisphaerales bacterium]MCB9861133.1 deoxyribose-phosphate aldolase [Phycisphaeraceae bacterium]
MPDIDSIHHLISVLDLTTLNAIDTETDVRALCQRAATPSLEHKAPPVAAVCVFPNFVPAAKETLAGSMVRVACVASMFPHGQSPLSVRLAEVEWAVANGADEIDIVINRGLARSGDLITIAREVREMASRCAHADSEATIKVILETCELNSLDLVCSVSEHVLSALHLANCHGAFLKTSTGKGAAGAELDSARVMLEAIRDHTKATGHVVGFKAAGGVRTKKDAATYLDLVRDVLGNEATTPARFRLGASSLLNDLCTHLSLQ